MKSSTNLNDVMDLLQLIHSGWNVIGTGDVNGGGYDDLLIGAPHNDQGDTDNRGETCLLLGKNSRREMDFTLSRVDTLLKKSLIFSLLLLFFLYSI